MFDNGKVRRWMGERALARLDPGGSLDVLDIKAIREGQAEARMRGYARRVRVWEVPGEPMPRLCVIGRPRGSCAIVGHVGEGALSDL